MALDALAPAIAGRLGGTGTTTIRPQAADQAPGATEGFSESLAGMLAAVDKSTGTANSAIAGMVQGTGDVHEAMLALQRAETAMQLTVQVRNKLVQAYQDVMRMPI
jgi:flagellar hook-basal body complex protein FliE